MKGEKVTFETAQRIQRLLKAGWLQRQIAARFGLSPKTVSFIATGKLFELPPLGLKRGRKPFMGSQTRAP